MTADHLPLGRGVPRAEAEFGTPCGDDIEGGDIRGDQQRFANAGVEDVAAQPQRRRHTCCGGQGHER
jgi:hypothetical protein